jgi:hypothetical protein
VKHSIQVGHKVQDKRTLLERTKQCGFSTEFYLLNINEEWAKVVFKWVSHFLVKIRRKYKFL